MIENRLLELPIFDEVIWDSQMPKYGMLRGHAARCQQSLGPQALWSSSRRSRTVLASSGRLATIRKTPNPHPLPATTAFHTVRAHSHLRFAKRKKCEEKLSVGDPKRPPRRDTPDGLACRCMPAHPDRKSKRVNGSCIKRVSVRSDAVGDSSS